MQVIGKDVILTTENLIQELFAEHAHQINQAYINAEDSMSVSISAKYKPNAKTGSIDVDVSMSFVLEKITDSRKDSVDEGQGKLYEMRKSGEVKITTGKEE